VSRSTCEILICGAAVALGCTAIARAELVISGLEASLEANVRALAPLATTTCNSARWRVERLFRDADSDIREALAALGYYEPSIDKSLRWDEKCWYADFDIDAGEPVLLDTVNIVVDGDAASDPQFDEHRTAARPSSGDVLNHDRYEAYKQALMRAAINHGYFDSEFGRSQVIVDRGTKTADLELQLQSGPRYRFGDLKFTPGILRESLLQGFSDIRTGEAYSAVAINDLYEALNGSSYFASVSISTEPLDTSDKIVPVTVDLTPAKRRVYSIGAGFATDTGAQGRLGYANRRRNDKGHQLDSKLFVSSLRSELSASYRWPKRDPRKEWLSVVAGAQYEDTDTSEHDTYKVGVLRSRNRGRSWLETRYLDYEYENFKVGEQDTNSQLFILGSNWEFARGRTLQRISSGLRLSFDVRGASESLGSDTNFLQLRSSAKWILPLGQKSRVLLRTRIGLTKKDELTELPVSVRFFAGGDRSVRGYDFETLGPVDENGDVIGGSNLFEASLELDRLLRPNWAAAIFVDTGSAFNGTDLEFSTGVGVGIRWYSPVGPIRLDFAHPLDDPDKNFRLHISLGPDL